MFYYRLVVFVALSGLVIHRSRLNPGAPRLCVEQQGRIPRNNRPSNPAGKARQLNSVAAYASSGSGSDIDVVAEVRC